MVEDFTRSNELLKKDIENKRRFLDQQKTENLELKAKKQKFSQPEEPRFETSKGLNLEVQLTHIFSMETENTTTSQDYHHQQQRISTRVYQQPFIMDPTVCKSGMNKNSRYPFGQMISWLPSNTGGLSKVHDSVGPLGLPDLNVSAEEEVLGFSSLKMIDRETATKAKAAQARLKRMQICRSKNYNAACKARYPFR
ncbi:uncharacterized protein LOC111312809 [Durio zibethinus]|uniref:Uncharacterized protein LOC111312809 n=1 Tax=Durio zibethinus TaxID=66656 RepID=A0A6P6AWB4_DURZI|nr:uncharacterized protein LOC111312809 [Durio zibethinus]